MRTSKAILGSVFLLASAMSNAGVILQATSATASSTFPGYSPEKAINQQGLSAGYVSGVTDFDTYVATATHVDLSLGTGGLGWFNNFDGPTSTFTMDFGSSQLLQRLVLWTDVLNPNNINGFRVLLSDDPTFATGTDGGSFNALNDPNNPTLAQVFDFTDTTARYLRIDITSNFGGSAVGFAEAAVETSANQVPEPGVLALLGFGLLGFAVSRRKHA